MKRGSSGVSLLELIIIVAIVGVLATIAATRYSRAYRNAVLKTNAEQIQSVLRLARQRAISQQDGLEWGVHFENPVSGTGFYEIYKTATYSTGNVTEKYFLDSLLVFTVPASGVSFNVLFARRTGAVDSVYDITLSLPLEAATRTIRVYPSGVVEVL